MTKPALIPLLFCMFLFPAPRASAQDLKFANIGDFRVQSGEVIHDCRIGYRTFGRLTSAASNAILMPNWANGTTEEMKSNIGPNAVVNDADYFVVAMDALANGVSSSPSNSSFAASRHAPK